MSQTRAFIARLTDDRIFGPGDRARLRAMAGSDLDECTFNFDLFSGLWWPLRENNQAAPRREVAWLITRLYGMYPLPHIRPDRGKGPLLAEVLGRCEPPHSACRDTALLSVPAPDRDPARGQFLTARRFRRRFDALLCTPLGDLEPHLHWALSVVRDAIIAARLHGIDWVQLTDDVSIWDRGEEHRRDRDIRDVWAEQYLQSTR